MNPRNLPKHTTKRNLTLFEVFALVDELKQRYGADAINIRTNLVEIKTRKEHAPSYGTPDSWAGKVYFL